MDVSVEPRRRGEGIGTALAEAADEHLARLGHLQDDALQLAGRAGRIEAGGTPLSAVRRKRRRRSIHAPCAVPLPIPVGVELHVLGDRRSGTDLPARQEVSKDIPNEFDSISLQEWIEELFCVAAVDDDASLAAYVDGELAGVTMIRIDRPSGRSQNNLRRGGHSGDAASPSCSSLTAFDAPQSLSRATIAITDNDETTARCWPQHEARLRAVRAPDRVGAGHLTD